MTIDIYACHSDNVRLVWDNARETYVAHHKNLIAKNLTKSRISDVIYYSDITCDSIEHHNQIDEL